MSVTGVVVPLTFDLQDDPDVIDGDEGEADPLVHRDGLSGEMLLSNRYLGIMTSATLPASKLVRRVSVVGSLLVRVQGSRETDMGGTRPSSAPRRLCHPAATNDYVQLQGPSSIPPH